jgi:hypothetical protein
MAIWSKPLCTAVGRYTYARRSTSETGKKNISLANVVRPYIQRRFALREENRRQEIEALLAEGKIPHSVEMAKHPEKSLEGHMCEFA